MKYRLMGKTGYKVSEIGFGAWQIGGKSWGVQKDEDSFKALSAAVEKGVNFIDTAASYGDGKSEKIIGEFIKSVSKKIFISTKIAPVPGIWPPSPYCIAEERFPEKYIRESVDRSLNNIGTDRLDIFLLHTWTRAWNKNPTPLKILQKLKKEGKIESIGISTPEHDQNSVIDLMKHEMVDVVEVIYNIFEQEPAAEFFSAAEENKTGLIGRVPFDEGALTGKYKAGTVFEEGDFRINYFKGDRLAQTLSRVEKIKEDLEGTGLTLPQAALLFVLNEPAISVVIPGMRNVEQANKNVSVSDMPPMPDDIIKKLRKHNWLRAFWYSG